ncbi:MAG: ABC transporter permease [Nitrospinota bacterium]|nr:MAG: ABC transporter permease [Nitrospinota bacterium]
MRRARQTREVGEGQWRALWRRFRKNRTGMTGLILVVLVSLIAIFAPLLAPYEPDDISAFLEGRAYDAPSWRNYFGTDKFGYDVFSRVLYGARTALLVGLGAMAIAALLGIVIGGVSGYARGEIDELLMRFTDGFLVIPVFIIILVMVRIFGIVAVGSFLEQIPHLKLMIIIGILGCFSWPPIARVARAEFLKIKETDFVEAAKCLGASERRIIFYHILPNSLPSLIVVIALGIGSAILSEAMISFLGFGDPSLISWGQMLTFAAPDMKIAPWAAIAPGLGIFITVLGFNLLADGLSDAANPRLKE